MIEKTYKTEYGKIHYWINNKSRNTDIELVFLPGLTADHRLFYKQIKYFEGEYPIFIWDAPGHNKSYPFDLKFSLMDKVMWLNEILSLNEFNNPIIIGQSMGGYLGQAYSQLFPEKLKGFISIDSAPLQREYMSLIEIFLLKRMEPIYRYFPWNLLLKVGTKGVAESEYGRNLMYNIMMTYDGDKERYAVLVGHGYKILANAIKADLDYAIKCPALLICGKKDHAGSCIRYNKAWYEKTKIPLYWIEDAGHNSNTDKPNEVNKLIKEFIENIV